jgi:hypothetical protein
VSTIDPDGLTVAIALVIGVVPLGRVVVPVQVPLLQVFDIKLLLRLLCLDKGSGFSGPPVKIGSMLNVTGDAIRRPEGSVIVGREATKDVRDALVLCDDSSDNVRLAALGANILNVDAR